MDNQVKKSKFTFEDKRSFAKDLLDKYNIKSRYDDMLKQTKILDELKQKHSFNFLTYYDVVEKWLDQSNTEYYCKINYQDFLSNLASLAEECEVIYFGIALIETNLDSDLKKIKKEFVNFFSVYNIPIDLSFYRKFGYKRRDLMESKSK